MAPHSKTCCAIPAHLHVIELLCYALIFKASRYMKMKWTKVAGYSAVAPIYQQKKCRWNAWRTFSLVSLVRFPYNLILFYIKAVVTVIIFQVLLRHCLLSSNTVSVMSYWAVRKSRRI